MNKLKLGAIALAAIAMQACGGKEGTNITGTIENSEKIFVIKPGPQSMDTLQSIDVKDNEFAFNTLELDTADFFILQTSDQYGLPIFVLPNDNIEVNITGSTPEDRTYTVTGSKESERVLEISNILKVAMADIDTLNQQSQAASQENMIAMREQMDAAFQKTVAKTQDKLLALIDEDPSSMANIFVFPQRIGQMQLINLQEHKEYYTKVIEAVNERYPGNKHIKNFEEQVNRLRESQKTQEKMQEISSNIKEGTPAPNIALPSAEGTVMQLSDLKGKVVLVDFWAAWCKPCRMENPNVVRMYKEYSNKGFEVFSVSLDGLPNQPNPKEAWTQAIEQDGLAWPNHVSDLQGWNSSVVANYGFQGIPYTVLVGRDGNILATNLRGPQLEAKLKEVL